jgi:hypothetical protein
MPFAWNATMSRFQRFTILVTALIAILLSGVVLLIRPRSSMITIEHAMTIREGMTVEEVGSILGGRARDETGGEGSPAYPGPIPNWPTFDEWIGPECSVRIQFKDGRVADVMVGFTVFFEEWTLLDRLRRLVGM